MNRPSSTNGWVSRVGQYLQAQRLHALGLRNYERGQARRMGEPDPYPGPDMSLIEQRQNRLLRRQTP